MGRDYELRLRCPQGDRDVWVTLENHEESLEQVLHSFWDFECAIHGVQREVPMEAHVKIAAATERKKVARPAGGKGIPRSSERQTLSIPVVVYGWSNAQGSFHEETTTLRVNDSGGLVTLAAKVDVGDTLFLMNKSTREEQGIRIVYLDQKEDGTCRVGLAFQRRNAEFWKKKRKRARVPKTMRVYVKGEDSNGHPFVQSAYTVDVSKEGARLDGVGYLTRPGDTIEVKRFWRRARFRVVWIGEMGTPEANQVGILCLEEEKNPWGSKLPRAEEE